jgi:FkbM family methyltransferase
LTSSLGIAGVESISLEIGTFKDKLHTMSKDDAADLLRTNDLRRIINDHSIVIDVGAHIGEFSATIRNISKASIYAFEPVPEAFAVLKQNLVDDKFFPIDSAISVENGAAIFHITESLVGSSFLPPRKGQSSMWLKETTSIEVKTVRLDTFIELHRLASITLLKTDAEGYDLRVLESAGKFLEPSFVEAVLVEMSFHLFHEGQDKFYKAIELLTEKGYFLAGFYPHFNHNDWLWWADVLFLPNNSKYSTNI